MTNACNLIKEHMPNPITQEHVIEICKLMDMNKDGLVDLNEFLESFRLVDHFNNNSMAGRDLGPSPSSQNHIAPGPSPITNSPQAGTSNNSNWKKCLRYNIR